MCRMIGRISKKETPIRYELLDAAQSLKYLSRNGCLISGGTGEHLSGCGVAWVSSEKNHQEQNLGGRILAEHRSSENCWDQSFISTVSSISSNLFIAHNRKASAGLKTDLSGAHPFLAKLAAKLGTQELAFCHNGDADMFMEQAVARGVPDSKLMFEFLLQDATSISPEWITSRLRLLLPGGRFSSLSGLLMTDSALCAWRIFAEGNSELQEIRNRYYTLYLKSEADTVTICSEPIDNSSDWRLLENRELLWIENNGENIEIKKLFL